MTAAKYTIELCRPGGPYAGIEGVVATDDNLSESAASPKSPLGPTSPVTTASRPAAACLSSI
jgi:hypothetical protein